jgi:Icc-related predicted phosphoesterase
MRAICLADLHGHLPSLPQGDVVFIAGDICPDGKSDAQASWLHTEFREWLESYPKLRFFATWGNHDWVGETDKVPSGLRCDFLINSVAEYEGLRIAGFPWTTVSTRWAFHKDRVRCEAHAAAFYHELSCDVIINHTPPYAVGDLCPNGDRVGSDELGKFLARDQPKVCITGHIHEGRGNYHLRDGSTVVHASFLDGAYYPYKLDIPVINIL